MEYILHHDVVAIKKGAFGSPSIEVTNFTSIFMSFDLPNVFVEKYPFS